MPGLGRESPRQARRSARRASSWPGRRRRPCSGRPPARSRPRPSRDQARSAAASSPAVVASSSRSESTGHPRCRAELQVGSTIGVGSRRPSRSTRVVQAVGQEDAPAVPLIADAGAGCRPANAIRPGAEGVGKEDRQVEPLGPQPPETAQRSARLGSRDRGSNRIQVVEPGVPSSVGATLRLDDGGQRCPGEAAPEGAERRSRHDRVADQVRDRRPRSIRSWRRIQFALTGTP